MLKGIGKMANPFLLCNLRHTICCIVQSIYISLCAKLNIILNFMSMTKRISLFAISVLAALVAFADRAMPGLWQTKKLPDGTELKVELMGDEHVHFWQTVDGVRYFERNGVLRLTDVKEIDSIAFARRSVVFGDNRVPNARMYSNVSNKASFVGKKRGLIILVEFSDKTFAMDSPQEYYYRQANEVGFKDGQQLGSVHDYFYDQSDGQFDLTFDVVGPVKMMDGYAYYGQDDAHGNIDVNVGSMLVSAINMVSDQVDWSDYDWNDDNEVEQVYFIYAGGGQATGAGSNTIWPHKHNLRYVKETGYKPIVKNGITIDTYACSNEVNNNGRTAGIGTLCHEFSHCLGLPDMYDTSGNSGNTAANYGMGTWDIMNSGSYNNGGYTPAGYTSWEKMMAGWLEPVELTSDAVVRDMKPLSEGGQSYIIYNPAYRNEYYMLEHRAKTGWDKYIPSEGMLILHVDYDERIFNYYNAPNTFLDGVNDHQRLTIFHADNTEGDNNEETDPYPYNNLNVLSNYSTPSASLHNPNTDGSKDMNIRVHRIAKNDDGTMSFVFGDLASADKSVVFAESFDDCNGTGANDNNWLIFRTAIGTFRPDAEGWSASYMKGGRHCARFGELAAEDVVTPTICFTGSNTLTLRVAPYAQEGTMTLNLSVDNPNLKLSQTSVTLSPQEWTVFTTEVSGSGDAKVTLSADCRLYVDDMVVIDNTQTGIENTLDDNYWMNNGNADYVYDLQGRRVYGDALKGVYVRNGKKIILD